MKLRIIASVILVMILSAGISNKAAAAYGGRGCHRSGWHTSHRVVRVCRPSVVVRGGYYARPFAQPVYYDHAHHRHNYRHHGCYR